MPWSYPASMADGRCSACVHVLCCVAVMDERDVIRVGETFLGRVQSLYPDSFTVRVGGWVLRPCPVCAQVVWCFVAAPPIP